MNDYSPLTLEEIDFVTRLLFETLHFCEPIEKTAEPKFRAWGLDNGAIENFIRVMDRTNHEYRQSMHDGPEPSRVERCPWENQKIFLKRDAELQGWIELNGGEPADITTFIRDQETS